MIKRFPFRRVTEKDNFSYLLASIIFLLFTSACVEQFFSRTSMGQSLVLVLTIISMSIGVWSIKSSNFAFRGSLGLVLCTMSVSWLVNVFDVSALEFIHLIFMLIFFLTTLKIAAEQALFSGSISKNNIIGSICIFLLLGLIWAMLFLLVAEFIPNSFTDLHGEKWPDNFPDLLYFSFVTLTTLGYGDIIPLSPVARFLAYIEAVIGVFYMAIVVSSLVGAGVNYHPKA